MWLYKHIRDPVGFPVEITDFRCKRFEVVVLDFKTGKEFSCIGSNLHPLPPKKP